MEHIKLAFAGGEGTVLHGSQGVAVTRTLSALGHFKKSHQRVSARIKEVVAQVFKRWVATVARPHTHTRRHAQGMHQGHAQDPGVEVHGGFHVIGVEGQVVNAPAGGTQVVGGTQGAGHCYILDLRKWL